MLTHIPIGPAIIPAYPFLSLIGLWVGMWLAAKEAERLGIEGDHIYNLGLYGLLAGLLGGRAWYVTAHWESYAGDIWQALALTANAIAAPGVLLCALAITLIYLRKHNLPFLHLADAVAPGAALTLIIGGLGAFMGSQTLGALTDVPWGVALFGQVRHPAHLYQVIATLIILIVLWQIRLNPRWPGFIFLLFAELYAGSRLLLDPFFATQDTFIGSGLRTVQVSALMIMVLILVIMMRLEQTHIVAENSAENSAETSDVKMS